MKNKSALFITILAFIIAIVVFAFMEKNNFNLIIGSAAVVLGLINIIQLMRKR